MSYVTTPQVYRNYGMLTDLSKGLNHAFGDRSGRTVSMRTAHGIKNTFNAHEMTDNTAEDIAHVTMIAAGACLFTKSGGAKFWGLLLLFILFFFYQKG